MKKAITFFVLIAFFSATYSATNSNFIKPTKNVVKASEVYIPVGMNGKLISLLDLSQIRVKEYESLTGKQMSFMNKVNFKIAQRQLKKNINPDGTFSKKNVEKFFTKASKGLGGFNIGGFALGLFLSLIGVLIAYLITTGDKKGRITWAWIGAAVGFIIWGAILI